MLPILDFGGVFPLFLLHVSLFSIIESSLPLTVSERFFSLLLSNFSPEKIIFFSIFYHLFVSLFLPPKQPNYLAIFLFLFFLSFRFCLLLTWHQQMVRTRGWCFGINSQGHVCETSPFGLSTLTQFRTGFGRADRFFESDLAIFLVLFPFKAFYFVLVII